MKVHVFYRFKPILWLGFGAITLFPFILIGDEKSDDTKLTLQHEWCHVEQVRRIGWLRFYVTYLYYYAKGLVCERFSTYLAYRSIPWEIEAYSDQRWVKIPPNSIVEHV